MSRLKWTSKPNIEKFCIMSDFPFSVVFLFIVRTNFTKMSLDTVGKLCHEFKILRQKSNLNIDYSLASV